MFVLTMAFIKNVGVDSVKLSQGIVVDILEDSVEKGSEVIDGSMAAIKIVEGSDGEVISDRGFHFEEEIIGLVKGYLRNLFASLANFYNVGVVRKKIRESFGFDSVITSCLKS